MPVSQLDVNLNGLIDQDAPPTIYGSKLTPELATASLNLSVDYLKQQQSMANKYLITHMYTLSIVFLSLIIYLGSCCRFPSFSHRSISGYVYQFILINTKEIFTSLIVIGLISSLLFTTISKLTELIFKRKIKAIVNTNGENVYNVNLSELANNKLSTNNLLENTHVVIYRGTPIAVLSISENRHLSRADSLVMGVSTLGCRHVYLKSGVMEDLLDWAMIRTKNIQQSGKYKSGKSMKLLIDIYSFDKIMKKSLKLKGFNLIESHRIPESRILGGLFGIRRELWGVQFHFDNKN